MDLKTPSEHLRDFGEVVREHRIANRLRLVDLAELSGASSNTVRRLERGESISLIHFLSILAALGIEIDAQAWLPLPENESLEDFMETQKPKRVRV